MEGFRELAPQLAERTSDLSEETGFLSAVEDVPTFDTRTNTELVDSSRTHSDPMQRERATWELAYREGEQAYRHLADHFRLEPVESVRWNLLWLATKIAGSSAIQLLEEALTDQAREVREWARLFLNEFGASLESEYQQGVFTHESFYDQTLPLQIAGFAVIDAPGIGRRRAALSPLWFEHLLGRVLASTRQSSFMTDLTIEKKLVGFHEDGSDHYEIFPFSGISWESRDGRTQHRYESYSVRDFYPSGLVHDTSQGVLKAPVILNRGASSSQGTLLVRPVQELRAPATFFNPPARTDPSRFSAFPQVAGTRLLNGKIIKDVRGQFFGWAFTSLAHLARHGTVLPGSVQLANPLSAETAGFVNTYLCGTFRGKAGDLDGDGKIDINLIPCHGAPDGRLDVHADGSMKPETYE